MSTQQGFPALAGPMVDANGVPTQVYSQFFLSLWNRSGGAAGISSADLEVLQALQQPRPLTAEIAGIGAQAALLASAMARPAVCCPSDDAELFALGLFNQLSARIVGVSAAGVTSFNTRTGAIVLAAGTNIALTESPTGTFTIDATGGVGTVTHTSGALTSGQLIVGNGTDDIKVGDLSGDVTTSGSAVTAIAANAVTTAKINNSAVTLAKIANAAASSKLVGSGSSGSGAAYSEITLGTNLSMSGTTLSATATPGTGGGLYSGLLSTTPTSAGTTLSSTLGAGAAVADTAAGVHVTGTAGMGAYTTTVPGTPYSITALLAMNYTNSANVLAMGWTNGTAIQFVWLSATGTANVQSNTNITTFSATQVAATGQGYNRVLAWFKVRDDGTNASFSISIDGVNFYQVYTVAKASGALGGSGYTHVFVGSPGGSGVQDMTVMSWTQGV